MTVIDRNHSDLKREYGHRGICPKCDCKVTGIHLDGSFFNAKCKNCGYHERLMGGSWGTPCKWKWQREIWKIQNPIIADYNEWKAKQSDDINPMCKGFEV